MKTWVRIIDEACNLWLSARKEWRDIKLEVGGMVHSYIVARLREEADSLNEAERRQLGVSRNALIADAARRLSTTSREVGFLIRSYQVVELLSDGGKIGSLSWTALLLFNKLVERVPGRALRYTGSRTSGKERDRRTGELKDTVLPSEKERWRIAGPTKKNVELFQRAVSEGWDTDEVRSALGCKVCKERGKKLNKTTDLAEVAETSDPKDLAEMLVSLVNLSPRRSEVVDLLLTALAGATR